MNLKEFLEIFLTEGSLVKGFKTSFKGIVTEKNWQEKIGGSLEPFSQWGRGVVGTDGNIMVTTGGSTHAEIKKQLGSQAFTFYWGYSRDNRAIYLEPASISIPGYLEKNGKNVANAVIKQMGFRK